MSKTFSLKLFKVEVIPGISDHAIVYVEASIKPRKVNKPPRKVYQYNKANTEELKSVLFTWVLFHFLKVFISFSCERFHFSVYPG
jgi:hypothetical protein